MNCYLYLNIYFKIQDQCDGQEIIIDEDDDVSTLGTSTKQPTKAGKKLTKLQKNQRF